MSTQSESVRRPSVELRTGTPYANLIAQQGQYARSVASYFGVPDRQVIPTAGTSGAIEAVRNHVYKVSPTKTPTVLTVSPGYWRAREAFEGLGFAVAEVRTQPRGFAIDESQLLERAAAEEPELIYLSLPNNPTGAVFDPELLLGGAPATSAVMLDLTLPSRSVDMKALVGGLVERFRGRRGLFVVGSTSKSHETAEHRIGWAVCASPDDADELRRENRNVVATAAIAEGIRRLQSRQTALEKIERSFALLREAEGEGAFEIVRPPRRVESGYVLIRVKPDLCRIRETLGERGINVMWGSEFGLTDDYIRLETLETPNVEIFVSAVLHGARPQTVEV